MDIDAWLDALRVANESARNVDGVTTAEASKMWGCSHNTATRRFGALVELGVIKHVGFRNVPTIHGVLKPVAVYAPVEKR